MVLSKDAILARKVHGTIEEYDLGDGDTIIIRGLTRHESHELTKRQDDFTYVEYQALAWGIVEPKMTYDEVSMWAAGDQAGVIQGVVNAIQRLSGSLEGQGKEATKSLP